VLEVPRMEATGFGVMHVDADDRIVDFSRSRPIRRHARQADMALASMGIYVFKTNFLFELLRATPPTDLQPRLRQGHHPLRRASTARRWRTASADSLRARPRRTRSYWRDVGTIDAYWEANIDLTDVARSSTCTTALADLDLRRDHATGQVRARRGRPARLALNSLVSGGCIVSGASLHKSLLFTGVQGAFVRQLDGCVMQPYVEIGRAVRACATW
jgi:glucose-1-phosphate adenylyltransferase